ncbi:TetR/AcrR family transcriptional regulator [Thiomicrorhabdus sp. Milos-T2]|uniref:TetR/AcrR family transcriptional regulator n=1 Tax=Thiomicrorhabdus sp. Milos-T2 TaxID=90814 RepID=UPI000494A14D|nr:TetR/AcrR family transcriptional regulator [Thiomicrorhabdus sp. Milos-T2]
MRKAIQQSISEPCNKRGLARQQKFLETAEELFLTSGYANTSVNEVVRLSGGSLGTLYRLFGNKLGLFEAVFKRLAMNFFSELEEGVVWSDDVEKSLMTFGRHMQSVVLKHDGIAIYRLVLMENNDDQKEIQRIYYKYGPQVGIEMLASYLREQVRLNKIAPINADIAATQFIEMVKGLFVNRLLFGEDISEEEVEIALVQGVQIFMKGISK